MSRENLHFQRKLHILTVCIGLVFFYFGVLKFFPHLSPAENIGISTVESLCLGLLPGKSCIFLLALLEVSIGFCLLTKLFFRAAVIAAIFHLVMTFTPLLLFPDQAFNDSFISPSLLGQYIIKNIVIISALLVIYPPKDQVASLHISN